MNKWEQSVVGVLNYLTGGKYIRDYDNFEDFKKKADEAYIRCSSIEYYEGFNNLNDIILAKKILSGEIAGKISQEKRIYLVEVKETEKEKQRKQNEDDMYLFCINNMRIDIQKIYNNYGLAIDEHEIEPFTIKEMEEQPWFGEDQREVIRKEPDYARIWKAQYLAKEIQNGNITVDNCCNIMGAPGPIIPGLHFCEKQFERTHRIRDYRPKEEVGTKKYTIEEWYQMVGEKLPSFQKPRVSQLDLNDIELI